MRKNKSQERNITSQKLLLCRCKPIARDFGKWFGGGKKMKKLTKVFGD